MMSVRQNITSIQKFTSQLCLDERFQILKGIQLYGDHVMEDAECVVKRLQSRKEKKSDWIRDQPW